MSKRPVAIKRVVVYSDGSADMAVKNVATGHVVRKTRDARAPAAFSGLRWNEPAELVPDDVIATPEEVNDYAGPYWRELAATADAYAKQETIEAEEVASILRHPSPDLSYWQLRDLKDIEDAHSRAANWFGTVANVAGRIIGMSDNPPDWIPTLVQHAHVHFTAGRDDAVKAHRLSRAFRFLADYRPEYDPGPGFFQWEPDDIRNYYHYFKRIPWLEWAHSTAMNVQQKTSQIDLDVV
jgi:hypothetical protein